MENPISRTAYYTLGVRAWDAAQETPLCGDTLAASLMDEDAARVWEQFKRFVRPNTSNAARHAIIDDHLGADLADNPQAQTVLIGAGFDTRAFRMNSGRWIEVDEPAVLTYKESKLPAADSPNPLTRVPIEFSHESLPDKLAEFATPEPTQVVIEGVLMYLSEAEREATLETLADLFPHHVVYCDLMRRSFFERYSSDLHEQIVGIGASFSDMTETPERLFLDAGYEPAACTSIPLHAARAGALGIPAFVIRWFMGTLRRGYCIWKFERSPT
jgi:methyltransferase (TIGR00027 family)